MTPSPASGPRTLAIDIGGTGIKMLVLDPSGEAISERTRELTPKPADPDGVIGVIESMLKTQPAFDRISVGFPGVVVGGIVETAPNLSDEAWAKIELQAQLEKLTGMPARVLNDADIAGYGAIAGNGLEMVLTLGTGMGSALFIDGRLVPNLELGHHPFRKKATYEDRVSNVARKKLGNKRWSRRVQQVVDQLRPIFNFDLLYLGGGNSRRLQLEPNPTVKIVPNSVGLLGGIKLWQ